MANAAVLEHVVVESSSSVAMMRFTRESGRVACPVISSFGAIGVLFTGIFGVAQRGENGAMYVTRPLRLESVILTRDG